MKAIFPCAALTLSLLLAGCAHKKTAVPAQPLAPPVVDTPLPKPQEASKPNPPPPVIAAPSKPAETEPAIPKPQAAPPAPKPKRRATRPAPTLQASAAVPMASSGVSAIGQLSAGDSSDVRRKTTDSINATEKSVNAITRPLSEQEQATVSQIREFLKQARQALVTGDVDGAHTLSEKARILLSELRL